MSVDPVRLTAAARRTAGGARRRVAAVPLSELLGTAAAVLGALLVGAGVLGVGVTLRALLTGVVLGATVYALRSDRPAVHLAAAALVVAAGLLVMATLAAPARVAAASPVAGTVATFATVAVGAVGFAAALAPTRAPGGGRVRSAAGRALRVLLGPVLLLAAATVPDSGAASGAGSLAGTAWGGLSAHLTASDPALAPATFGVVLLLAALAVRAAASGLPWDALVPPERADGVVDALDRAERALSVVAVLALLSVVVGLAVVLGEDATLPPAARTLVETGAVRVVLLFVLVVAAAAVVGHRLQRFARRASVQSLVRFVSPTVAGAVTALVAGQFVTRDVARRVTARVGGDLGDAVSGLGVDGLSVLVTLVAGAFALGALLAVVLLGALFLPRRTAGPALAAGATFTLALVAALLGQTLLALVVAVLALVAWDGGDFGAGVRRELASGARTSRAELVHVGAAVAVGAGVVVVALLAGTVLSAATLTAAGSTLAALVLATAAALLLLVGL